MIYFEVPTIDVEGVTLTQKQMDQWLATYPEEYEEYKDAGLFDPSTGVLLELPEWMTNSNAYDGPFDFGLHPSEAHWGI